MNYALSEHTLLQAISAVASASCYLIFYSTKVHLVLFSCSLSFIQILALFIYLFFVHNQLANVAQLLLIDYT